MTCDHRPWADRISDLAAEVLEHFGREAMARVDELIENKAAAPVAPGTAAGSPDCLESKDMSSISHHESMTVLGRNVVAHSLSGHPEFKGLVEGADGPMVRIQDGDLVLLVDDLPLLLRWRQVMELAAVQLGMGLERRAAHAKEAGA